MFELSQRYNPTYFQRLLENDWQTVSLHSTEEHARIRKLEHEQRSAAYEYRITTTKD